MTCGLNLTQLGKTDASIALHSLLQIVPKVKRHFIILWYESNGIKI